MMRRDALISYDGLYRYTLNRDWDNKLPTLTWIMLNPSKASATLDNPTVKECVRLSTRFGFGGLLVLNLFAFRAIDPKQIKRQPDPVGPNNNSIIETKIDSHGGTLIRAIVLAWGNHGVFRNRNEEVLALVKASGQVDVFHLGLTLSGQPRHPLGVMGRPDLSRWEWK